MHTDIHDQAQVELRLWDEIEDGRFGMLGLMGDPHRHFQPMTAFVEPARREIWFFTRTDTDLARDVGEGSPAMFVFQAKDQDVQACIGGELSVDPDRARIEKYWNAAVAAWYPDGRDDPRLTMLRLDCSDAQVWISNVGPVRYAWEVARANLSKHTPDVGGRASLDLH